MWLIDSFPKLAELHTTVVEAFRAEITGGDSKFYIKVVCDNIWRIFNGR